MNLNDAQIVGIPKTTKTEQRDQEWEQLQRIFTGDDISGLDLEYRRNRRVSVDIDEYLKQLDYNPHCDGVEDQTEGPGVFKSNYRMALKDDAVEIEEEKGGLGYENSTNHDSSQTNLLSPGIRRKRNSNFLEDRVSRLEPLRMDLGLNIKARLIQNFKEKIDGVEACVQKGSKLYVCPSLNNVRIYTRHNSLVKCVLAAKDDEKAQPKSSSRKGSDESILELECSEDVKHRVLSLDEDSRRTFVFTRRCSSIEFTNEDFESTSLDQSSQQSMSSLVAVFLDDCSALVLEFQNKITDIDEGIQGSPSQEELTKVHIYEDYDVRSEGKLISDVSMRLEYMLKQEGAYTMAKFVQKLAIVRSSKVQCIDASMKSIDCKVRSIAKSRPDEYLDPIGSEETTKTTSHRRRSRFLDYDDYGSDTCADKNHQLGSFSL